MGKDQKVGASVYFRHLSSFYIVYAFFVWTHHFWGPPLNYLISEIVL